MARALLLKGSVFVHLDPRRDEVHVPEWLKHQPQLVLQVGLDMPIPIPDLRIDDVGVFGTLSFRATPFRCVVPWEAVFALVGDDGRGMVWPESMPAEIAAEVEREAKRRQSDAPQPVTAAQLARAEDGPFEDDGGPHRAALALVPAPDGSEDGSVESVPSRAADGETDKEGPAPSAESQPVSAEPQPDGERRRPPYLRLVK